MYIKECFITDLFQCSLTKGSGYRFTNQWTFIFENLGATCNLTVTHNEYAEDCTRLGRNILITKPEP